MTEIAIPQLVAHRGWWRRFPENTWPALEAALGAGACWLEFDVQMCGDNRFVLLHDDNLRRTAGIGQDVLSCHSHRLTASVHEPARFGERFAPLQAPALDDVLDRLTAWPAARVMLEIKQESLERHGLAAVMKRLLPLLKKHRDTCTPISYNPDALAWLRRHADLPTGWVLSRYDDRHRRHADTLAPDYLICNADKLPPAGPPWPGPWQWMLYDIVDPELALAWAARGVDLVETADIGGMLQDTRLARRACRHASV